MDPTHVLTNQQIFMNTTSRAWPFLLSGTVARPFLSYFPPSLTPGFLQSAVGGSLRDGQGFAGCVAAVSIWDAALPIGRIRRVMAEGLTGAEPSLVLLWEFDQLIPGGTGVRSAVPKSKEGQGEGTFRGKNSIEIEDAWLPGDVLQVGLGVPASPKERIQVRIRSIVLDASIISNASIPRFFLHVTFAGSGGDAVDETLRCRYRCPTPRAVIFSIPIFSQDAPGSRSRVPISTFAAVHV